MRLPVPGESLASELRLKPGEICEIEEVQPDAWLTERDAARLLALDEQVFGQSRVTR